MKISKGTIIRTVMLALVLINFTLKQLGHDVLNISETEVGTFIEMVVSVATIIVCYWKNNSVSPNAIKADEFLHQLNEKEQKGV